MGNPKVTTFFHFQPALVHDPSGHPAGRLCQKVPKGAKVKTVDRRPTNRTSAIFFGGDPMETGRPEGGFPCQRRMRLNHGTPPIVISSLIQMVPFR